MRHADNRESTSEPIDAAALDVDCVAARELQAAEASQTAKEAEARSGPRNTLTE